MNSDPQFQRALAKVNQASDPVEEVRDIIEIHGSDLGDDDLKALFEAPYEDILFVYSNEKLKNLFDFAREETELDSAMQHFNSYVSLMKIVRLMAESKIPASDSDDVEENVDFSKFSNSMSSKEREKFYESLHQSFYKIFTRFVDDDTKRALIEYSFISDEEPIKEGAHTYGRLVTNLRPLLLNEKMRGRVRDSLVGFRGDFPDLRGEFPF